MLASSSDSNQLLPRVRVWSDFTYSSLIDRNINLVKIESEPVSLLSDKLLLCRNLRLMNLISF